MKNAITEYFKLFAMKFKLLDLFGKSAEISYYALTSLFPLIIFIVSLLPFLNINPTALMTNILLSFPESISGTINYLITYFLTDTNSFALSIGLIFTLISASGVFTSVFKNLKLIYNVEEQKNTIILKMSNIFDLIFLTVLVYLLFSIYILSTNAALNILPPNLNTIFLLLKSVFLPLLIILLISYTYYKASKTKNFFLEILPGSITFLITYIVFTKIYALYLIHIINNSLKYGFLSSILLLLLWIFTTSLFLLIGALVNATLIEYKNK